MATAQWHPDAPFAFEGVLIHPDHLSSSPRYSESSDSSAVSYEDDHDHDEHRKPVDALDRFRALHITSAQSEPVPALDYFSPIAPYATRPGHASLGHANPGASLAPDALDVSTKSTLFEAGFSCATYRPRASDEPPCISPGSSTPLRAGPAARRSTAPSRPGMVPSMHANGSASMLRSISSPVESQRSLDARRLLLDEASAAMDAQAVGLVRTRSCVGMSRLAARLPTNENNGPVAFEADWGVALPRHFSTPHTMPYPYNLAVQTPSRLFRSHSTSSPHKVSPPLHPGRQNSLPSLPHGRGQERRPSVGPLTSITPTETVAPNTIHDEVSI